MAALSGGLASRAARLRARLAPPPLASPPPRRRCRAARAAPARAWSQHHRHHAHAQAHPPPPPPPPPQLTRLERAASAATRLSCTAESLGLPPFFPPPSRAALRERGAGYVAYAAAAALLLLGLRRAAAGALSALARALTRAPRPPRRRAVAELDGVTLPAEAERAETGPREAPQEAPPNPVVELQPALSRALLRVSTEDAGAHFTRESAHARMRMPRACMPRRTHAFTPSQAHHASRKPRVVPSASPLRTPTPLAAAWYLTRLWAVASLLVVYAQELLTNTTALRP
jgi:hypothetical protein